MRKDIPNPDYKPSKGGNDNDQESGGQVSMEVGGEGGIQEVNMSGEKKEKKSKGSVKFADWTLISI